MKRVCYVHCGREGPDCACWLDMVGELTPEKLHEAGIDPRKAQEIIEKQGKCE